MVRGDRAVSALSRDLRERSRVDAPVPARGRSQVAEVLHGAPSRFSDPARFSLAHGGKDGHPFPVPLDVYDGTLRLLRLPQGPASAPPAGPCPGAADAREPPQARTVRRRAAGSGRAITRTGDRAPDPKPCKLEGSMTVVRAASSRGVWRRRAVCAALGALWAGGSTGCAEVLGLDGLTGIEGDGGASPLDGLVANGGEGGASPSADASTSDAAGAGAGDAHADASTSPSDAAAIDGSLADASACATDPCDMADGLNEPFVMASDSTRVYWVDFGDTVGAGNGELKSCGVDGCGGSPDVWQTSLMDPRGIAVDASNVYWATTWGGVAGAMGAIWSCPLAFGPAGCSSPTKLASALDPDGIALDAQYVYWVDPNTNTVHRVRTNGQGTDQVLYGSGDGGLGVFLDGPDVCAVDGSTLYIVDGSANVYWMPKAGGTPQLLLNGSNINGGLAVDGLGSAYFGEKGALYSGSSSGPGSVSSIVADGVGVSVTQPVSLVVDVTARMLYWADFGSGLSNNGAVGRATLGGGSPTLLHSGLVTPQSVTVSGNYAYWLSAGDLMSSTSTTTSYVQIHTGRLWRTAK